METPALFVVLIAVMGLTSFLVLKMVPSLEPMAAASSGKYQSLDALRGLLASFVLVAHAFITRDYFRSGEWARPTFSHYHLLGGGAVAVFFMITGLLFWGKALDGRLGAAELFRSRVRRIMPLYLFSFALILAICMARSGFELQVSVRTLCKSVVLWLTGGLLGTPWINGVQPHTVNAGVTWTLQYEWCFYLLLPALSWFIRPSRFCLLVAGYAVALLALHVSGRSEAVSPMLVAAPFFGGMVAAYAVRSRCRSLAVRSAPFSAFVAGSLICVACLHAPGRETGLYLGLIPAFVLIALGNDFFGMLNKPWVRWLGHISFSVYLLHGLVLLSCLTALNSKWPVNQWSDGAYIAVCAVIGAVVVVLSSVTYLFIERTFIAPASSSSRHVATAS